MIRKLVGLLVVLSLWGPQYASALGLGEMQLNSVLNERLRAEILLRNVGDLSGSQILVGLASKEDFERVGVDRLFFLTHLQFEVKLSESGPDVVVVTTKKPVKEPYLDFVLELRWPTGRLLREYTALMDLPVYTDETPTAVVAPREEKPEELSKQEVKQEAPKVTPTNKTAKAIVKKAPAAAKPVNKREELEAVIAKPEPKKVAAATEATQSSKEYGPTRRNDTLWDIAKKVRAHDSVSIQQTMLALQRLNPDAFINNNINLLKRGKVLRVPSLQEVQDITRQNAYQEVAAQNLQWKDKPVNTELPQLDATPVETQQAIAPQPEEEGHLTLAAVDVASDEKQTALGTGGEGENAAAALESALAVENELAISLESLEKAKRENEEMESRLAAMEEQLATLQKLVAFEDEKLAALQAAAASDGDDGARVGDPAGIPTGEPQQAEAGVLDKVLSNTLYLAIVAAVLVLLVLALLVSRRNNQLDDFELAALDAENEDYPPEDVYAKGKKLIESSSSEGSDQLETFVEQSQLEESNEALHQELYEQTDNVIGEADIFIAYGRHQQAVYLLLNAIEEEPKRADYLLKLLEVYADIEDQAGFKAQYDELLELHDAEAEEDVRQLLQAASLNHWLDGDAQAESASLKAANDEADELAAALHEDIVEENTAANEKDELIAALASGDNLVSLEEALAAEDLDLDVDSEDDQLLENELDLGAELNLDDDASDLQEMGLLAADLKESETKGEVFGDASGAAEFEIELDDSIFDDSEDEQDTGDFRSTLAAVDNQFEKDSQPEKTAEIREFQIDSKDLKNIDVNDESELLSNDMAFLDNTDEIATKLDLARAYIEMGDAEGARDILEEVLQEGAVQQQDEATELLGRIA